MTLSLENQTSARIETSPDGSQHRYSFFDTGQSVLRPLMDRIFSDCWSQVVAGTCIEGAVFEIRFAARPELRYRDGYLTVDLGHWHFHLCIGPTGSSSSEELNRKRPISKAALFERRGKGCAGGKSWGLRFWNGFDEQVLTVFLPNPNLTDDMSYVEAADWRRLQLYFDLRKDLLGEPIPADLAEAANAAWQ